MNFDLWLFFCFVVITDKMIEVALNINYLLLFVVDLFETVNDNVGVPKKVKRKNEDSRCFANFHRD